MATYQMASSEVVEQCREVIEKYHGGLRDAGVTIDILMAYPAHDQNGDATGPAVSHGGYPAAAKIRIVGLKDRAAGRADAEMIIDGEMWPVRSPAEQNALLDHEVTHLELVKDSKGNLKRDDLDRPCLKCRKHDHQHGWFDSIVRRHGSDSLEWQQAAAFLDRAKEWGLETNNNEEEV